MFRHYCLLFLAPLLMAADASAFFRTNSAAGMAPGKTLPPMPKNPALFQVNTRVCIGELTQKLKRAATLDDYPDSELEEIAKNYDVVYFLGVWQTGDFGIKKSVKLLDIDPCMKGLPKEAACSSPFAITDYSCHKDFGGDECLARLRDRVHAKGMRLLVDFVPNHMAVDHPWTKEKPELLVQGSQNSLNREPQNFFKVGDKVFAHGKDMYYDGWEDTVQINYGNPAARREMENILKKIAAGLADGVRCDMAMLMCEDVLEKTWGGRLAPFGQEKAQGQFWPPAIKGAKACNDNFIFVAECYWDREYELQQQGFDFCYDKTLYDRLKQGDSQAVIGHLKADLNYQHKLVRFLENHDEERAAAEWVDTRMHQAAAVISFTIPGLRFFHDGQQLGRKRRVSMHVNRRDPLDQDVKDKGIKPMYERLINALKSDAVRDGEWRQCHVTPSNDQNPSFTNIVSHVAWKGDDVLLVVVNFSGDGANGHIILPSALSFLKGKQCVLTDYMSDHSIEKDGSTLLGENNGMWMSLDTWKSHVFKVTVK